VTIEHRGLVNVRAALAWAFRHVAAPRAVFVSGCSAGSVAWLVYAPYPIEHYRRARVTQLGDSEAFVFPRPVNLEADWNAAGSRPCDESIRVAS
jgi:hypothetical protein